MKIHAKEITERGRKYVRIPVVEYQRMIDALEDAEDLQDVRAAKKRIEAGEETIPSCLAILLMDAKTVGDKLRIWREHRGFSKVQLGEAAGISGQYINMIESGKRKGSSATLTKLSIALGCMVDDLI